MSKIVKSLMYFFNDSKQGMTDSNTAVEEFEGDKNYISISFIRELIQNAIDAALSSTKPVRLVFKLIDIDKKFQPFLKDLHKDTLPLVKCGESLSSKQKQFIYGDDELYSKALVVEEYNTIGLTGPVDRKINDEPDWHFSNFMFGRKRSSKSSGGGSKGVGKITSNLASELRTVMFITSRSDDGKVWAGGKIEIDKPIRNDKEVFNDVAFLSSNDPGKALGDITDSDKDAIHKPIQDKQEINLLKDIFKISRPVEDNNSEFGTSWIIPAPLHATGDSKKTNKLTSVDQYLQTILSEYGWAIMKGLIEIDLDGTLLNKNNIISLLKSSFPTKSEKWNFFEDIASFPQINEIRLKPNWHESEDLEEAFMTDTDRQKAYDAFESDSRDVLCLKLPLSIIKEDVLQNTFIKLFIQKSSDEDSKSNEMLYRNYLLITNESNTLSNAYGDSINAMLLIDDHAAVNFCRAAEQADHLKFVIKQATKKGYKESSARENLSAIRSAVKKAYELFNNVEIEDQNLFSNIFSIITPLDLAKDRAPGKRKSPNKKTKNSKKSYPSISQILMEETAISNELIFKPGPNKLRTDQLPLKVQITAQDQVLLASKLNVLNPSDAGLSKIIVLNQLNSNIQRKSRDFLEFEITSEDFELHIKDLAISRAAKLSMEY